MRLRPLLIVVLVAVLLAALAVPAAAVKPIESHYTLDFQEWNPCSGAVVDVTGTFVAYDHPNNHSFISPGKFLSASTSDGYHLVKGHDRFLENKNHLMYKSVQVYENEDGLKFRIGYKLKVTYDGAIEDERVTFKCFGAPTILPPE